MHILIFTNSHFFGKSEELKTCLLCGASDLAQTEDIPERHNPIPFSTSFQIFLPINHSQNDSFLACLINVLPTKL